MPLERMADGPARRRARDRTCSATGSRAAAFSARLRWTELLAEHRSGRRKHAGRLWALLILERWFRRHAPDWRMAA